MWPKNNTSIIIIIIIIIIIKMFKGVTFVLDYYHKLYTCLW